MNYMVDIAIVTSILSLFYCAVHCILSINRLMRPINDIKVHHNQEKVQQDISIAPMTAFTMFLASYGWVKFQIESQGIVTTLSKMIPL